MLNSKYKKTLSTIRIYCKLFAKMIGKDPIKLTKANKGKDTL
jgi:hypothetical protein